MLVTKIVFFCNEIQLPQSSKCYIYHDVTGISKTTVRFFTRPLTAATQTTTNFIFTDFFMLFQPKL
jgi:hypothetical protein